MHKWFVNNIKFAPGQPKQPMKAASKAAESYGFSRQQTNDSMSSISISIMTPSEASELSQESFKGPERHVSFRQQPDESALTFSISLKSSNAASSYLICQTALFNPEWMRSQNSKLFRCSCSNCDELDYTCKFTNHHFLSYKPIETDMTFCSGSSKHFCTHHDWSTNMGDPCIFKGF